MTFIDNEASQVFGIDVSNHQGNINWTKIARAGVNFAFIKATEGGTYVDKFYRQNMDGARTANLLCGAYHFFRPTTPVEVQVENFLKTVDRLEINDLQPVLDLEVPNEWKEVPANQRIQLVFQWITAVSKQLETDPIIYLSPSFATQVLGGANELSNQALWVAHYTNAAAPSVPPPWPRWSFWQYTNQGKVDGIEGNVDLDRFNGTEKQLRRFAKS